MRKRRLESCESELSLCTFKPKLTEYRGRDNRLSKSMCSRSTGMPTNFNDFKD
jgi:hypothetical protein